MKLAVICRPFSFHGGTETATAGLMAELVRRGHAVAVLAHTLNGSARGIGAWKVSPRAAAE